MYTNHRLDIIVVHFFTLTTEPSLFAIRFQQSMDQFEVRGGGRLLLGPFVHLINVANLAGERGRGIEKFISKIKRRPDVIIYTKKKGYFDFLPIFENECVKVIDNSYIELFLDEFSRNELLLIYEHNFEIFNY